MASDPRKLKPSELCRLLNSTPLGEVISERQLYRHRQRAGARIGDNKTVDLLRYCAWMHVVRHTPKASSGVDPYEAMKERARARNAALALAGRDIGQLPEVDNPDRKDLASRDFRFFCEQYFPSTFYLPWSPDHVKVIEKIENAVLRGGLFALAMPRSSGKSVQAETACIWAMLYGHRDFVCLIGSDEGHACDMLDSIKTELDCNDLLLADFPEVCFPIRSLEGIANRANGQLYHGKRTLIGWTAKEIVLPTIEGSKASGAIIKVAGLTGRIRGMKHKTGDGRTVRPSLVVLDDPQTDDSARSLSQCANRESILAGAVLGLAGPGKKISGIMPCTVIRPGDMADNILDRNRHPEWNGERTKMVYSFPKNQSLWERYAEIRAEGMRNGDGGQAATEFYRENQPAMDEGAVVAWQERFNYDELSAIQHAMNLKLQDKAAFFAEYQNEPLIEETVTDGMLGAEEVATKINCIERGLVSIGANHLTAFIDVQQKLLFYLVAAWEDDFTGYVIDYGCYPDQHRPYFTLREARQTLSSTASGTGLEGSIYAGLECLTSKLLDREWQRDDGAAMRIGRCLIDANWGQSTDVVYQFCRQSRHAAVIMPSHGRFVGASSLPFSEYRRRPGDRVGLNWRIPNVHGKRAVRHVVYDTNWWKSFINARLRVAMGDRATDGEAFALLTNNPSLPTQIQLDLRLIEADQVTSVELGSFLDNSVDGIEFDQFGNPKRYHILRGHPGEGQFRFPYQHDSVPAASVLHWYRMDRPGQARGIPDIMPALPLFAQLRRYTLAVLAAAETAADFAGILYTDAPAGGEADAAEPFEPIELEKRALLTMPGGWRMEQMRSEQPSTSYGEFKHELLNEIARCLNMPYNVASANSSGYNYASGRLDHQTYYKAIRVEQSHLECAVLDRLLAAWFDEAALVTDFLPAGLGPIASWPHQWFWDGHEHVDPAKEANAQATRLASHTTTLADEYARRGQDWETQLRQRAKELSLMNQLGLVTSQLTPMEDPEDADDVDEKEATRAE